MSFTTLDDLEQKILKQKILFEKCDKEKFEQDNQKTLQMAMQVLSYIDVALQERRTVGDSLQVIIPTELTTVGVLDILSRYYIMNKRSLLENYDKVWIVQFK